MDVRIEKFPLLERRMVEITAVRRGSEDGIVESRGLWLSRRAGLLKECWSDQHYDVAH